MDIQFQDRIDDYLLGRMSEADKEAFLQEVEQDNEKKEQLEFTRNVKETVCSREEKLRALTEFQRQYDNNHRVVASACPAMARRRTEVGAQEQPVREIEKPKDSHKRMWLWISGIAAVLVVGFFAVKPMFEYEPSPNFNAAPMRDGGDVFPALSDSTDNDTIKLNIEKKEIPDE